MRLRGGLGLGAAALVWLVASHAGAQQKSFKDWTASCDNLMRCSAFGFSGETADPSGFIRLNRDAGGAAAPKISLNRDEAEGAKPQTWRVLVDGKPAPGLGALAARQTDSYMRVELTPAQGQALLAAMRGGSALTVENGSGEPLALSLSGSNAALLWIDDKQGRVGGATALISRGAKPASAVPPAPAMPVVRRGAPVSQAGLPKTLPKALRGDRAFAECDADTGRLGAPDEIHRLSPGVVLWATECDSGAYNAVYAMVLADDHGRNPRPVGLFTAPGEPAGSDDTVMNISFDPKTQTLTSFGKGRGIGDCGEQYAWVWDGKAFQLTEASEMGECRGLSPDEWPVTYRAAVR